MATLQLRSQACASEYASVLDWVDYHVITNKLSLNHWRRLLPERYPVEHGTGPLTIRHPIIPVVCRNGVVPLTPPTVTVWVVC